MNNFKSFNTNYNLMKKFVTRFCFVFACMAFFSLGAQAQAKNNTSVEKKGHISGKKAKAAKKIEIKAKGRATARNGERGPRQMAPKSIGIEL